MRRQRQPSIIASLYGIIVTGSVALLALIAASVVFGVIFYGIAAVILEVLSWV